MYPFQSIYEMPRHAWCGLGANHSIGSSNGHLLLTAGGDECGFTIKSQWPIYDTRTGSGTTT